MQLKKTKIVLNGPPRASLDDVDDSDDDDDDSDDDQGTADHPPELQPEPLLPLPETNVLNYAQENGAYFLVKRYVRTDRVKLEVILNLVGADGDRNFIRIPELIEIYGKK
jgi:hypothetical protein